jgi:IPT/TIG domain
MRARRLIAILASLTCVAQLALMTVSDSQAAGGLGGFKFIGSVDTMKLSRDHASEGFTSDDAQAVDLTASMAVTHITVDTPLEYPSVMVAWANRIHNDGKHVWFRLGSFNGGNLAHGDSSKASGYRAPYDGYPELGPGYLTTLHELMLAHPGLVRPGDILDGNAEAENSSWWADNYGCGVQQACTPCPELADMTSAAYPCSPVSEFNRFLQVMTEQENWDLASLGISPCATPTSTNCVLTQVHSVDPGTAQHELTNATVQAMGNLVTIDAYPDRSTTNPAAAAKKWLSNLEDWYEAWKARGLTVTILVGEWGYSSRINVGDVTQAAVIQAETSAFQTVPYLLGTNYWVGPGWDGAGGYTHIFTQASGSWKFRPAAPVVSDFYAAASAAAPTVTAIEPRSGTEAGGTPVKIVGTGFVGVKAVTFGASSASFTVVNETEVNATAPRGSGPGPVHVTVSAAGGTSGTSSATEFTYVPAPTIHSVSPNGGPEAGGTSVTITGTGFGGATAVAFGGIPAASFTVTSPTSITARTPAGKGTVDVTVTTVGGTSATVASDRFTYTTPTRATPPPSLPSIAVVLAKPPPGPLPLGAPKCAVRGTKVKVLARKTSRRKDGKRKRASLLVSIACDQASKVGLTGVLTKRIGKKPTHGRLRSKRFRLGPATGIVVKATEPLVLTLKLPSEAAEGLERKPKARVALTLVAQRTS